MNRIKKLMMCILGGVMIMGLTGCNKEAEIRTELAPMYEVLDQQSIENFDILSIEDSLRIYGMESAKGFQTDLTINSDGQFEGMSYDLSVSETEGYPTTYIDGELKINTTSEVLVNRKLMFEEFHFSEDYFNNLELVKVLDHPNTYMKDMSYQEKTPSDYTKKLIETYGLTDPTVAKIEVSKTRHDEKTFSYILTYSLYDEADIEIIRVFKFVMEDIEDE
ncbi:hypothetical protein PXH68_08590 [Streptococcus sp. 29896]|nr:hypothetical protein [Streptococcus sp. 29896]WNY46923.1 hypothetical protein PXH68_08590 [Streptococcus sp. 29896]